jgi:hypothetical protein
VRVIVIESRELRRLLEAAPQALLDRVSELADEPQEELLQGIAEELRQQLKKHRVRPARRAR